MEEKLLINRENIVAAISETITGYETNSLEHDIHSCSMCKLFYRYYDNDPEKNFKSCGSCPSQAFIHKNSCGSNVGCADRGEKYDNLNYGEGNKNDQTLALYWRDIKELYVNSSYFDVMTLSTKMRTDIKKIARKYNAKKYGKSIIK